MIHLPALPGAPGARVLNEVLEAALRDAQALSQAGFDGVMVENFGDRPFLSGSVPRITVAVMTRVVAAVRDALPAHVQLGVNVLRNDAASALAVATACGANFIRVNVHSGIRVTDQGLIEGRSGETLRLREAWGGASVALWADVDVKHSAPLGTPRPLGEEAEELVGRACADALVVTGRATGTQVRNEDLEAVVRAADGRVPVVVGSGVDELSVGALLERAQAVLVGTSIKEDRISDNPVDPAAARRLVAAAGA